MKKLYDETYSDDNGKKSRNIWYSNLQLSTKAEYGFLIHLSEEVQHQVLNAIKIDLSNGVSNEEINWYFYDAASNKDALGENPRASLMIKQNKAFVVHFNFSDLNFAINFEQILENKIRLETLLEELSRE